MKVFIIAAMSADGFIARREDDISTDWTSKEDRKLFVELTKQAGVMVMGSTTYHTIGRPLPGRRNIVYNRTPIDHEGVETTSESPAELVKRLESEGHSELAVCGGATIYDMFLQAGVVDELYLSIEPVLFATGVPLLKGGGGKELRLLDHKKLNDNTILMHYEVKK
jgi:dihydrofolate reductase